MPNNDWLDVTLGDFVTLQRGHDLPDRDRQPGSIPILGSFGVTGYHDKSRAPGPGVTVGRSGASFGVVSYSEIPFWPLNTALYVRDFHGNDERFAYYFLQCLDFKRFNSGSAQPSLNRNFIHPIEIKVPPVLEQRAIASILGALDDKIEVNRKMSATLEAIARALFKSWFVDFDPVHAKAESRDPGLPAEIAALFPDSFDRAVSTNIPNRWTVATVGDVFVATMGQSPPGYTYNKEEDGLPFYQGRADFGFRFPKRRVYCKAPTRYANAGDTLLSVRAPVGDINLAIENCSIGRGVAALRHNSGSSSYTFYATRFLKEALETYNGEGTVFGSISKADLSKLPILEPPVGLVSAFDRICGPLDERVALCQRETDVLVALRDALLPKLISGELRVGDVERVLAAPA